MRSFSTKYRTSYAKAMNHGDLREMSPSTPEIKMVGSVQVREVRRTLRAVLLAGNGIEAWFPMYGL